ncbi:MAG: hypothetical protein APF81_22045 [Desulfosporosinus sp. BRH_c37]|nr:MAG: hypothetical protein APF81_22045 [Desulfosporosinus sp. BRH_c37]
MTKSKVSYKKVTELKSKIENTKDLSLHSPTLSLPCFGGFDHGEGYLKYRYRDIKIPFWQFSNIGTSFVVSDEFVEKVISDNLPRVIYFFQHPENF